ARRSPVRCRCLRRIRSASAGNTRPAPKTAAPASRGRTPGTAARRRRRSQIAPAPGSAAGKRDGRALRPARLDTIAAPGAGGDSVFPSPWLDLTLKHLHEEMVFRHGLLSPVPDLPYHGYQQLLCYLPVQQPVAVLAERARIPDRIVHVQTHEPPEQ